MLSQQVGYLGVQCRKLCRGAIELDNQYGFSIQRVPRLGKGFRRLHCHLIHHLHTRRNNPSADNGRNCAAGVDHLRKCCEQHCLGFGLWQQRDGYLGDNTQHAFRAADQRQ